MRRTYGESVMSTPHSRTDSTARSTHLVMHEELDRESLDALFSAAYEELRRLASSVGRGEPGVTLGPTALVHEAWLKLAPSLRIAPASELHFKRIAARAMRQVLVEAARRRRAGKRGGPDAALITLDDSLDAAASGADDVLGLDEALDRLAALEPRQAQVVECRYFGGLEVAQTAELLSISEATVLRDWRAARAWLARELSGEGGGRRPGE